MRETTLKPGLRVSTRLQSPLQTQPDPQPFVPPPTSVTYSKTLPNTLANCDEVPVSSAHRVLFTLPPFDPLSLAGLLLTSFLLNTFPTA